MKRSIKLFAFVLVALVTVNSSSFASGVKEKALSKAKQAVEQGAPDDWMLLAKQSEYLLGKNAGLSTVKEWLETSIKIKEDAYNLELMGDYYQRCNLNKQAIAYYLRSMDILKANDATVNTKDIQAKIIQAKS